KEVSMEKNNKTFLVDLGIYQWKLTSNDSVYYYKSNIGNLGDLSTMHGYNALDGNRMNIFPGKIYPDTLKSIQEVRQLNFAELLKEGYTDIIVETAPDVSFLQDIPLNIVAAEGYENEIELGALANFYIKEN